MLIFIGRTEARSRLSAKNRDRLHERLGLHGTRPESVDNVAANGHFLQLRLLPFLLLSLCAHGALLAWTPSWRGTPAANPLRIVVVHPSPSSDRTSRPTQPILERGNRAPEGTTGHSRAESSPPPPDTAPSLPISASNMEPNPSAYAETEPAALTETHPAPDAAARVLSQIKTAMARFFSYPRLAKRRGWEGEVLLGFSVLPDGRIDNVTVVQSSGHRLLDEAARDSLARVRTLSGELPHPKLRLELPVVYRLTEG